MIILLSALTSSETQITSTDKSSSLILGENIVNNVQLNKTYKIRREGCEIIINSTNWEIGFEPYFKYNNQILSCSQIPSSVKINLWKEEHNNYFKYGVDFSNISTTIKNGMQNVILHRSRANGLTANDVRIVGKSIYVKDLKISHDDILRTYTIPIINKSDIVIGNLTSNFKLNSDGTWNISFDPLIQLTSSYLVEDLFYQDASLKDGTLNKWGIGTIPLKTAVIEDAQLCLYINSVLGTPDNDVTVWKVSNNWTEVSSVADIDSLTKSLAENKTLSSITNFTWSCINITRWVNNSYTQDAYTYSQAEANLRATIRNLSIKLEDPDNYVGDTATTSSPLKMGADGTTDFTFEDAENTGASGNTPYLNITYSLIPPFANFTSPTYANNTYTANAYVPINVSITNLSTPSNIIFNWNGTNYSLFDSSLRLYMNFDNEPSLGEDDGSGTTWGFIRDITNNNHNGVHGASTLFSFSTTAKYGKALKIHSVNPNENSVQIQDGAYGNRNFSDMDVNNFTVSYWCKPATNNKQTCDVGRYNPVGAGSGYVVFRHTDNKFYFQASDGVNAWAGYSISGNVTTSNQWYYVTAVHNSSIHALYLNGNLVASTAGGTLPHNTGGVMQIGALDTTATQYIDELSYYSRALSQDEIRKLYFLNLKKSDVDKYNLQFNGLGINSTSGLTQGTYTYYAWVNNSEGDVNQTQTRTVTVTTVPYFTNLNTSPYSYGLAGSKTNFSATANDNINVQTCGMEHNFELTDPTSIYLQTYSSTPFGSVYWVGETFQAPATKYLKSVQTELKKYYGANDDLHVHLYSVSNQLPVSKLATGTIINRSSVSTNDFQWFTSNFTPYLVTQGTWYAIIFEASANSGNAYYHHYGSDSDSTRDYAYSFDNGTSWTRSTSVGMSFNITFSGLDFQNTTKTLVNSASGNISYNVSTPYSSTTPFKYRYWCNDTDRQYGYSPTSGYYNFYVYPAGSSDTIFPRGNILSPENGTSHSGIVTIDGNATDNSGISYVYYQISGLSAYLDPISNGTTNQWNATAVPNYAEIDDGTRQPNAPDTANYIYSTVNGQIDEYNMSDTSETGLSVTKIRVWAYCNGGAGDDVTANIYVDGAWQTAKSLNCQALEWRNATFTGAWDEIDLNNLNVRLTSVISTQANVYAMYVETEYENYATLSGCDYITSTSYDCNWDTSLYTDGKQYQIKIVPVDSYGNINTTTTPVYLTVDNSIPYDTRTTSYPFEQSSAKNGDILTFNVTGLTDGDGGAGIDVNEIYLNASNLNTSRTRVNFTYISGLNETGGQTNWYATVKLFNSTTNLQTLVPFRASDLTAPANTWKTNFVVKIDNDKPYYNFTEWNTTWGIIYNSTNVSIQLHVYDNNNMSYFFNLSSNFSGSWTNVSYNYSLPSKDTYASVSQVLTTGTYSYYLTIFDNARNSNTTTINNITILGNEPEINISLISPQNGANITTSGNITFYYNYTSWFNASACVIVMNGADNLTNFSTVINITQTFTVNFTVNATNLWSIKCNNTDGVMYLSPESRDFNVTIIPYPEGADTTPPTVTLISPPDNYYNNTLALTLFNCTATDTSGIYNISLYLTNSTNQSFSLNATNTSSMALNTFNVSYNMSNGNYTWNCYSCDNSANKNCGFATANRSILINYSAPTLDTTPPTWSNNKTFPVSPATYAYNQNYSFNVTWNDNIAISTVIIEHNFTGIKANYTVTNNYTYTNIGAGTYQWKEYANDTSNNWNMTDNWVYIINQAVPSGNLTSSAGWSTTYGTPTTINYSESNLGDADLTYKIYRNNTDVGIGTINLSVGSYQHILNTSGGLNYTSNNSMDIQTLTVNQAQSKTSLTFDLASPQTYNTSITPTCSIVLGVGASTLTRNGTAITSGNSINLGAGNWLFNCSLAESQNYTSGYNSSIFVINQNSGACNMLFNESSPLAYPRQFKAYTDCTSNYTLYRNGTTIANNSEQSLSAGTYNFSVSRTDTLNYSNYFQQQTFIINRASSTCSITSNTPQTYSAQIQVNGTCSNPETTIILKRNNTDVTAENGTFVTLGAGYYFYNVSKQETENYTFANATTYVTVNQNSSIVYLYLNGSRNNLSMYNNSNVNITGILSTGIGNIQLYQNGTLSNQGASPLTNISNFSVGYYNLTIKSIETQNYTANFETWFLNVTSAPILDTTPPSYTNFQNNASTVTRINGVVNWSINLADNIGLSSYIFAHNQSGSLTNSTPSTISGASAFVNTTLAITLKQGNYICAQYWFNDTSNNVNQTSLSCFTVANSIPTIPNVTYPVNGNNYTSIPYINYSSSDGDNDAITYKIYINRTLNASTTVNLTLWNASDGYYTMNVSATDGINSSSNASTIYFTLDSVAPTVNIIYPTNGLNISSNSIYLNASATDARATSLTYYWLINGTVNTTTINFNSTFNASDGYYNLTLKVSDGLQNGSSTINFRLDAIPIISNLRNTSTTNQSSYIQWSCSELCNYSISWYNHTNRTTSFLIGSIVNSTFSLSHSPLLENLTSNATYFINLTVRDNVNNLAYNDTFNFTAAISTISDIITPTTGGGGGGIVVKKGCKLQGCAEGYTCGDDDICIKSDITPTTILITESKDILTRLFSFPRNPSNNICDDGEWPILDKDCNITITKIKDGDIFREMWIMKLMVLISLWFLFKRDKSYILTLVLFVSLLIYNSLELIAMQENVPLEVRCNGFNFLKHIGGCIWPTNPSIGWIIIALLGGYILYKLYKRFKSKKKKKKKPQVITTF